MRYVKIKSKTYNDSMMKLKMDYGDDAIPVSHRYIKEGGIFSTKLFAKDFVELTAAIPEKKGRVFENSLKKSGIDLTIGNNDIIKKSGMNSPKIASSHRNSVSDTSNKTINSMNLQSRLLDERMNVVKKGVDSIKVVSDDEIERISKGEFSEFKKFAKDFKEIKESLNSLLEIQGNGHARDRANNFEDDEFVKPYFEILKKNDFDYKECISIIEELKDSISKEDLKDRDKIEKVLKDILKSKIVIKGPLKSGIKKKIIMFIGPTGVGKTTTMAKLGAIYALREDRKVSFITIDNYRIAATEQLKKYSEIMKIPLHVVNDQDSFKKIIEKEKAEMIMVDTSGRSHKNELKISEIKSYADRVELDFEKILCVSANTKKCDLAEIFKAFNKINFDHVIITKIDEATNIGSVINVADNYKKPISYYTTGQEVPNDITLADSDKIVNMIIRRIDN